MSDCWQPRKCDQQTVGWWRLSAMGQGDMAHNVVWFETIAPDRHGPISGIGDPQRDRYSGTALTDQASQDPLPG
jgi:hypothetical protein